LGISTSYSDNARTNNDLSGAFWNFSVGGGIGPGGNIDGYYGSTDDGRLITGGGITAGEAIGGGVTITRTYTWVTPLFNVRNLPVDTGQYNTP
jgi:hypothetical protein